MRIGMVLDGHYPSDIRVRKEAESLAEQHDVFVLCTRANNTPSFEIVNGVNTLRKIKYHSKTQKGLIDVLSSINFINPVVKNTLSNFVKKNKIDVIHVHDLPLAKTAYIVAKKHGIKTVLDLHENYPAALKTWFSWRKNYLVRLKNKLFFGYRRWRKYESMILKKYDVLISVVDEMKERLINQHNISENKIIVVPNAEKKEFAKNFEKHCSNYFLDYSNRFIISYVGGFGPHRGLHTAIEAMNLISKKIPNALLVLVGPSNKDVRCHLESIVTKNNLTEFVLIKKREPFSKVMSIMKNSNVNIIPHVSNEHTESAVPHKFFQILLSGKPLLVSDCAPMKRIIKERNVGNWFKAENSEDFAKQIIEIHENYESALEKAKNGYNETFNGHLNWEFMSKELLTLYDNL